MKEDQELKDMLFTLDVFRNLLPQGAHPAHYERLDKLERIVKTVYSWPQVERRNYLGV